MHKVLKYLVKLLILVGLVVCISIPLSVQANVISITLSPTSGPVGTIVNVRGACDATIQLRLALEVRFSPRRQPPDTLGELQLLFLPLLRASRHQGDWFRIINSICHLYGYTKDYLDQYEQKYREFSVRLRPRVCRHFKCSNNF